MIDLSSQIAKQIKKLLSRYQPETLLILGSGLSSLGEELENSTTIPYSKIKGFPVSSVVGHEGKLICGNISGKEILCMQGRFHLYEGYAPHIVTDIIKAFKILGIKNLIITNAAGSLNPDIAPGSLMLINDHLNFSGFNPLIGPNDDKFGPRFPSLAELYTPKYRQLAHKSANKLKIKLFDGIYCMVSGPSYETAAEIKAYRLLGADAAGMSTVPEAISAAYCQMKIIGISTITNYCTGVKGGNPSHEETIETAQKASADLALLVKQIIKDLPNG